jgi:hypothetical protein
MPTYHNTAIVFGGLKDALLHFEYVIPMNLTGEFMGLRPARNESGKLIEQVKEPTMDDYCEVKNAFSEPDAILKLYPPQLAKHPYFKDAVNCFDGMLFAYMVKTIHGDAAFREYITNLAHVVGNPEPSKAAMSSANMEALQRLFAALIRDFSLKDIPIDCSHFLLGGSKDSSPNNSLFIRQIRVIDTSRVKFPQIMEFRKDQDTMNKMRKFRLFAYENYDGKSKAFIEDDIQKRLSDYNEVVKACGFDTTIKTLTFLFESKLLVGALATSAASLLMGNAQLAMEAFSAGAILEVGKLSLEYAKQRNELRGICRENPISYIAHAKDALEERG